MKNKIGSITLSTIILFLAFSIGLIAVVAGTSYLNSLRKTFSATQFAAESIEGSVNSYDAVANIAEFEEISVINSKVLSILKGNLGIGNDLDLSDTFVSEMPIVELAVYNEVFIDGMNVVYKGKSFHFDKPGVLIAVTYRFKSLPFRIIEAPEVIVVRKYEYTGV